jgi:AP-2 complex subunit alpha
MSPARRHRVLLAAALCVLAAACAPASERPLRGAVPGTPAPTPPGLPPTLVASGALQRTAAVASPSPGVAEEQPSPSPAAAQPSPSPAVAQASPSVAAAPPIVRTIVPIANGHVPGGPVTLSAVLVGRTADLESASLLADGADAGAQIDKRSARDWTIHATQQLSDGPHTVRVLVRDASGLAGGFTWQITVGEPDTQPAKPTQPPPSASPRPAQ